MTDNTDPLETTTTRTIKDMKATTTTDNEEMGRMGEDSTGRMTGAGLVTRTNMTMDTTAMTTTSTRTPDRQATIEEEMYGTRKMALAFSQTEKKKKDCK